MLRTGQLSDGRLSGRSPGEEDLAQPGGAWSMGRVVRFLTRNRTQDMRKHLNISLNALGAKKIDMWYLHGREHHGRRICHHAESFQPIAPHRTRLR